MEEKKKKKSRTEIEAEVRLKVNCEEKAFRWVEHLALVDNISEDVLAKMLNEIMVNHYRDITEERAISKVCGYPLCSTKLGKRSPNKYHISMKYNKVIDLSIRENFCSLYCFRASKFIEDQIPLDPIWLRGDCEKLDIKLLEKDKGKKCGVPSVGEVPLAAKVDDLIENSLKYYSGKKKQKEKNGSCDDSSGSDDGCPDEIKCFDSDDEFGNTQSACFKPTKKSASRKQTKLIDPADVVKKESSNVRSYLDKINQTLKEWLTNGSFRHLHLLQHGSHDSDDDDDFDDSCFPGSDFRANVASFLSRQPEWLSEACGVPSEYEKNIVLPTVDSRSQMSIRRRIVHEKVASSLREILPVCGLLEEDLSKVEFFKLIDTFNFTSKNIVLNSKEWTSVTIVLLMLISYTYRNTFGGMKDRLKDINDFLVMRSLPNISQIEEATKTTLETVSSVGKHIADSSISGEDDNTKRRNKDEDLPGEIPASYYYDNMEEVD